MDEDDAGRVRAKPGAVAVGFGQDVREVTLCQFSTHYGGLGNVTLEWMEEGKDGAKAVRALSGRRY